MINRIFWSIIIMAGLGLGLAVAAFLGVSMGTFIALALIYAAAAAVFASFAARKIVRPLRDLETGRGAGGGYREISPLMDKLTRQSQLIDLQMSDLRRSQEEFRAITDNMAEGFALVDTELKLLSYNASARKLMNDEDSESLQVLERAARAALKGQHSEQEVEKDGRVYQVLANPVEAEGKITGAVIVSLDITEKARREAMRHDFSSNVSHELRTPLTSIYGISELMVNGMVKPEDVTAFAKNIHDESGRLITLINDIIKLSQLDEGVYEPERADVDLYETARSVVERLRPVGAARGIEFALNGVPAVVNGLPSVIDEMVYNLCDNAVKYNVENGRVLVNVFLHKGCPALSVSDTGIGIPKEHQDRVFERFYRVDKSHSKEIGGTGLGLSIVKHGAAVHGADVSIKSAPDRGTVVTVTFPKPEEPAENREENRDVK